LTLKALRRSLRSCQAIDARKEQSIVAREDQSVSGMAGRYATALFDLAREAHAIDEVSASLDRFDAIVAENPDLNRLVRSPVFSAEEQVRALSAVLDGVAIEGLAANFLKLVASNRRLFALRDMIKGYRTLVAHHKREVRAEVTFAERPTEQHLEALKEALKSVSGGHSIDLDVRIDSTIIGGLIVKLGSRMVDASLKTKLNAIKQAMKEVG
jgi:F-type H+-transporting ATPase subunit delta